MANNDQLIADLGEAIRLSNESQVRFGANNDSFNRTINAGLAQINATIRDIDGMLGQIADKINVLKARIAELEANGDPGHDAEIAALQAQLTAAQNGQVAATEVMNRALVTLRANTTAMDGSIAMQDEPAMTNQLKVVNDSLQAMQLRLRGILNDNPGPQGAVERRREAQGEDSDDEESGGPGAGPAVEREEDSDDEPGAGGGKRRRRKNKTAKKQRKTRRTKTKTNKKRKQKGGYKYKTKRRKYKQDSDTTASYSTSSNTGIGRGMYKKSKKRRSTRP